LTKKKEDRRSSAEIVEGKGKEELEVKIAELQAELEREKAQAEENLKHWQRTQADFSNFRKRVDQEKQELTKFANSVLILKLLAVLDDFDRALESVPPELRGFTWLDGIVLVERKLRAILEQEGLTPMEVVGKDFDPLYHEAVMHEETADHEDGKIISELQKGYMLGNKVLRPALVKVANNKGREEKELE